MIHPSYKELIQEINDRNAENTQEPLVKSRYSIVIAASRRARQLVDGHHYDEEDEGVKALSVAVDELYRGDVNIVAGDQAEEAEESPEATEETVASEVTEDPEETESPEA